MEPNRMPSFISPLLVAVLLGGLFYLGGQWIQSENEPNQATISVSGDGRAFAVPDIAEISVGVQTGRQSTATRATEILKERMDSVIAAVKAQGVEDKDIRTENFWLNPVYDYTEGRQIPRGFEATQSLRVKVRDMDKVSAVLGAATNAGANQAGNVQFTLDDPDAPRDAAREEAIEEAQAKAKVLADQLGVRLGKLIGFGEGGGNGYPVPMLMEAYGRGGAAEDMAVMQEVQLPAGEQEIKVNVTLTYEVR
jgi:uncharacterized protein